jgi:RNA polymerase sigma-70 factor, ECF subfamily
VGIARDTKQRVSARVTRRRAGGRFCLRFHDLCFSHRGLRDRVEAMRRPIIQAHTNNPAMIISGAMRPQSGQTSGSPISRSRVAQWPALDQALLQSIANGSEHAMRMLFARHSTRIYRFLIRFGIDESRAEDLMSEVFLAVWRLARRYQGRSQVSTWLLAIARNKAISERRRWRSEQFDEKMEFIADPNADPELALQTSQRADLLLKCLTRLSCTHREIIDLVYYHEKSIDEVAELVGVPKNTVKTRMFYARSRLAKLLRQAGVVEVR